MSADELVISVSRLTSASSWAWMTGGLGSSGGDPALFEVFLNEHLFPILVDDALSVSNKERHDVEAEVKRGATKECGDGSCDGAVEEAGDEAVDKFVDNEGGRCGAEVVEGENCT